MAIKEHERDGHQEISDESLRTALVEIIANSALREEQLEKALESRDVIGQAKGILMERERISAEEAFQMLCTTSQHLNRKLRDVAAMVVASTKGEPVE